MNEINRLQILISQITTIRKQHEKVLELSGEKFNVFNILGLSTNEVRTHSAFIGELLNPKGSHCQKYIYLYQFTNLFKIENFDYTNSLLEIEKSVGYISDDKKDGGNIDIIITDKNNNAIIIENKIYAVDQENQLLRYYNYGKKKCKSVYLFYLTLDGKEPSKFSTNELDKTNYTCISYSNDIKKWLEICKEKSENQPIIRETLSQYINLIKELTNQSINRTMNFEIVKKIVSDDDNLKTLFELHKSNLMADVQKELTIRLKQQLTELAYEFDLTLDFNDNLGFEKETKWVFFSKKMKNYSISFEFCNYFYQLVYGISNPEETYSKKHRKKIETRLGEGLGWENYLWIKDFDELNDWNNSDPWLAIIDNSFKSNVKEKLVLLLDSLKDIDN
jgi:hypothetical protein